jgi:RelA/SpoT family (p)ppGpp synthetase
MPAVNFKIKIMERPYFNGDFDDIIYRNQLLEYFITKLPENIHVDKSKIELIKNAFNLAYDAHKGQRRKGGYQEPYITHPVEVAIICANEMGLGTLSIMASLLHDVVEDTNIKIEEIEQKFNKRLSVLVSGVTKIKNRSQDPGNSQVNSLVNLLYTFKIDSRVLFIKIADRLHNMRTMDDMPDNTRQIKTGENLYIYAPLAHLSGLYLIRNELQDLSFKYRYPEIYEKIIKSVDATAEQRNIKFDEYKNEIIEILQNNAHENFRIVIAHKSLFSIWQKMQKYNIPFQEIHNYFSIKVIINTELKDENEIRNDCFKYFVSITSKIKYNQSTTRDWLLNPKNNGFSALVFDAFSKQGELFEIQITTEEKHQISDKGFANGGLKYSNAFDKLVNVITNKDDNEITAFDLIARIQTSFITQFIRVYTPKRREIELPKDATVLDFAFQVHSELGFKCIGAKISGKPVLPTHKVSAEDTIEILTSPSAKPDEKWQYLVLTNRAREELTKYFKKNLIVENTHLTTNIIIKNKEPLVVDENLFYLRPKCCNALPGDDCIAYQDDKKYIHIHKRSCFQAIYYTAVDGKNTTNVIWRPIKQFDAILKGINISGTDRKGIIKDVVNIVTDELNVNMQAMDIASNEGVFKGKIFLYVYNNSFLNNMINKLAQIDNVNDVSIIE